MSILSGGHGIVESCSILDKRCLLQLINKGFYKNVNNDGAQRLKSVFFTAAIDYIDTEASWLYEWSNFFQYINWWLAQGNK